MNRIFTVVLAVFALTSYSQDNFLPESSNWESDLFPSLETFVAETFDHTDLFDEDARIEAETGRYNIGRIAFADLSFTEECEKTVMPNGDLIYRLKFQSEGAEGVSVYFDQFYLPGGCELYVYSPDLNSNIKPLTSKDNTVHGRYNTDYVLGDEAVIELYQPLGSIGVPNLEIRGFGHFYRDVYDPNQQEASRGSDPCQVNVNCPEGEGWEAQRDAVVRLRITDGSFIGLCTGVMVNTTAMDCRQYLLSAMHCTEGVSDDDLLDMQVRWNYERPNCTGGSFSTGHNRVGVERLADSNDGGGASGSDFVLCEVLDDIPLDWDPFYAGWDASGSGSSEGVCVHHPSGDVKKISTYGTNLVSSSWGTFGTHWRVVWMETETEHGVTEGGSSGSPIYNEEGLIVGTLTGGGSFCTSPNSPDYYGKMSEHWDQNPNASDQKLKVWLDPINSGEEIMFGSYAPDCASEFVGLYEIEFNDIELYPNPVNDHLNISINRNHIELESVDIYDSMGKLIKTLNFSASMNFIDMSDLAVGSYFVTFSDNNGQQLTKRFTKL